MKLPNWINECTNPYYYMVRKWNDLKCWCRYNLNRYHWNVIKKAICGYPFDYSYMLDLQRAKLEEMYNYFLHSNITEDSPIIRRDLKLIIKLLKIINEEKLCFTYEPPRNIFSNSIYKCLVNVNLNNIDRFVKNDREKKLIKEKMQHELYLYKAKNLYYKLLMNRMETWWD